MSVASSTSDGMRPNNARIVACMLLIKSEAGSPLPETSATQIRCVCSEIRSAS